MDTDTWHLPGERWLPIEGWEGLYEVSDLGRVRSLDREIVERSGKRRRQAGKVLSQGGHPSGYLNVGLYLDGRRTQRWVHQLVLEAFVSPRPFGMEACHGPGGVSDNRPENLRWDTHAANIADRDRDGIHPMAARTHCKNGHELTEDNVVYRTDGSGGARRCLICRAMYGRRSARLRRERLNQETRKAA